MTSFDPASPLEPSDAISRPQEFELKKGELAAPQKTDPTVNQVAVSTLKTLGEPKQKALMKGRGEPNGGVGLGGRRSNQIGRRVFQPQPKKTTKAPTLTMGSAEAATQKALLEKCTWRDLLKDQGFELSEKDHELLEDNQAELDSIISDYRSLPEETNQEQRQCFLEVRLHEAGIKPEWAKLKEERPNSNISMIRWKSPTPSEVLFPKNPTPTQLGARRGLGGTRFTKEEITYRNDPDLQSIFQHHTSDADNSHAFGITKAKGGLRSMIDIMVDGKAYTTFHGPLLQGIPEASAGNHGPSYVVLSKCEELQSSGQLSTIPVDKVDTFVVQNDEAKEKILASLDKAEELHFITPEKGKMLREKVQTYKEYATKLKETPVEAAKTTKSTPKKSRFSGLRKILPGHKKKPKA